MINEIKYYFYKYYKYLIILFILLLVLIYILKKDNKKTNEVIEKDEILIEEVVEIETQEKEEVKKIKIDIKGAVKNPGVYEVDINSRVDDAIKISGGLNSSADTTILNLSKSLKDEDVIVIYTKEEINEMKKGSTSVKVIEKECICPKLENVACIENTITNSKVEKQETNNNQNDSKISLNNASKEQLETLPGIGSSKAQAIIDYRKENGGFKTIDDLKNVSGIGNSTFEKLKDLITT